MVRGDFNRVGRVFHDLVIANVFPAVDVALDEHRDGVGLGAKMFCLPLNDLAGARDDDVWGFRVVFHREATAYHLPVA